MASRLTVDEAVPGSRTSSAGFLDALRVETLCLREFSILILRHVRYLFVVAAIYRYSLFRWRKSRILRAAYCLAQHVDDVLDGDRSIPEDPERYAAHVIRAATTGIASGAPPMGQLAVYVMAELRQYESGQDDPRGDLLRLFDVLVEDRRRVVSRRPMGAQALEEHHRKTFHYSLNLMFLLVGSRLRGVDAADLIGALSWCSPIRDLEDDFAKGLVNIPDAVLEQALTQGATMASFRSLIATPAVRDWLRSEYRRGSESIERLGARLKDVNDRPGRTILTVFHRALSAYLRKYRRRHKDLVGLEEPREAEMAWGGSPITTLYRSYRWLVNPYEVIDAARERMGQTFWVRLAVVGRVLVTGDPDLIRQIMDHSDLDAGRGVSALPKILGGRSLITLDGEDHAARRRILAPIFRRDLDALDGLTIDATEEAVRRLRVGESLSVYELVRGISLTVIIRFLFGDVARDQAALTARLLNDFLASFESPAVLFLRPLHIDLGPLSPWGRALRNRRRLVDHLRARIRTARREEGEAGGVLRQIVRQGPKLTDDEVLAELLALLLFGHDTAAATLAWAFAHIYEDLAIVTRIREEAESLRVGPGRFAPETQRFLAASLKESMRLCPVVAHLTRVARRDTMIGGRSVPEGSRVFPSAYLAQHNPAVFPDPGTFRPERFLDGLAYDGSFFPFGFGTRTCIGKHFAMRQMILITSTIVRRAELTLAPGYRSTPVRRLLLILPRDGTRMVLDGVREVA